VLCRFSNGPAGINGVRLAIHISFNVRMVTYRFYCFFETALSRELSGKISWTALSGHDRTNARPLRLHCTKATGGTSSFFRVKKPLFIYSNQKNYAVDV